MKEKNFLLIPKKSQMSIYPYWNQIFMLAQEIGIKITPFVFNTYNKQKPSEPQARCLQNFVTIVLTATDKIEKL